jgi:superfamily II DNA/RNA helicase
VARLLLEGTDITVMLAIGGTTFTRNLEQIRKRKPSILVGTPGRIAELVVGRPGERSGRLKVGDLQALVLDEFDALLEYKPHRDPTNAIIGTLKKRHGDSLQLILCSATASDMMGSKKIENILRPGFAQAMADQNDRLITSGGDAAPMTRVSSTAIHGVLHVPHRRLSLEALRSILHTEPIPQQALIFADTARRVDIVIEKVRPEETFVVCENL